MLLEIDSDEVFRTLRDVQPLCDLTEGVNIFAVESPQPVAQDNQKSGTDDVTLIVMHKVKDSIDR